MLLINKVFFRQVRLVFSPFERGPMFSRLCYRFVFPPFSACDMFSRLSDRLVFPPLRSHLFPPLRPASPDRVRKPTSLNSKFSTGYKTVTISIKVMRILHVIANSPLGSPRSLSCKLELLWLLPWPRGTGLGIGKGLRGRSLSESFIGKLLKLLRRRIRPSSEERQDQTQTYWNGDLTRIFESKLFYNNKRFWSYLNPRSAENKT